MFAVISYRQSWTDWCGRCADHLRGSNDSDFEIRSFDSKDEVATYIANRIEEDTSAEYVNLVFEKGQDTFNELCNANDYSSSGHHSIDVPEAYDADEETNKRKQQLNTEIYQLVEAKIAAKKEKEAEEKAKKDAEEKARQEASQLMKDAAELERLKLKLGKS